MSGLTPKDKARLEEARRKLAALSFDATLREVGVNPIGAAALADEARADLRAIFLRNVRERREKAREPPAIRAEVLRQPPHAWPPGLLSSVFEIMSRGGTSIDQKATIVAQALQRYAGTGRGRRPSSARVNLAQALYAFAAHWLRRTGTKNFSRARALKVVSVAVQDADFRLCDAEDNPRKLSRLIFGLPFRGKRGRPTKNS